jgi:hypothetical protein
MIRSCIPALALAASMLMNGAASGADVTTVLARTRQALVPGKDMRANVTFDIRNERGEDVRWTARLYRKSGAEAALRLVFDAPLDLRETDVTAMRTASGEARTTIYLPAVRRVREITADARGESFLGTDFNYEDIGLQDVEYEQHRFLDDDEIGGRPCYRVESIPGRGWWYGKIVRWIDKKDFIPRRTEYYDRAGVLWKVRTFEKIRSIDGHPTWTRLVMETVPTHTSTTITLHDIEYDTGLSPYLFEAR